MGIVIALIIGLGVGFGSGKNQNYIIRESNGQVVEIREVRASEPKFTFKRDVYGNPTIDCEQGCSDKVKSEWVEE